MALNLTELQAVTDDYFEKTTTDIYFESSVLLWMLMSGAKGSTGNMIDNFVTPGELVDGGEKIRVFVEYDEAHSGTYGATTTIPVSKKNILNAARFRWAGAYASNSIDLSDQTQNAGSAQLVDIAFAKLQNMQKTIRKTMGASIFTTAADSNDIIGLADLFNTTTSTAYGEIAQDDMSVWKANSTASGNTMGLSALQALRRTAKINDATMGGVPNLYVTTDALKDKFENTLQTQARYRDVDLVNAGFNNILFDGASVVTDANITSGYVMALNTRFLMLKTHREYAFTKPVWTAENPVSRPDNLAAQIRWQGQLITNNRKAHAQDTNVLT